MIKRSFIKNFETPPFKIDQKIRTKFEFRSQFCRSQGPPVFVLSHVLNIVPGGEGGKNTTGRFPKMSEFRALFGGPLEISHPPYFYSPNAQRLRVIFGVQNAAVGAASAQKTRRTRAQSILMLQKLVQNTPAERVRVLRRFSARRALILRRMRSVCA